MKSKTIHYGLCGLEYVYLVNVPLKHSAHGEYIDVDMEKIEKAIVFKLIQERVPLRGREVAFMRKALGLPRAEWAQKLGVSAAAILKWEREKDRRLFPVNEIALRSIVAEKMKIHLEGWWSVLISKDFAPKEILIDWKKLAA